MFHFCNDKLRRCLNFRMSLTKKIFFSDFGTSDRCSSKIFIQKFWRLVQITYVIQTTHMLLAHDLDYHRWNLHIDASTRVLPSIYILSKLCSRKWSLNIAWIVTRQCKEGIFTCDSRVANGNDDFFKIIGFCVKFQSNFWCPKTKKIEKTTNTFQQLT